MAYPILVENLCQHLGLDSLHVFGVCDESVEASFAYHSGHVGKNIVLDCTEPTMRVGPGQSGYLLYK